ncbi:MAG: hypothetical protein JSS45_10680 [Proteobacteria bacterium]|nr:hypothetical protein [Pseudomonadota bacterium]
MFCSASITEHLLRGALACIAIAAAFAAMPQVWPTFVLLPIALVLMRGWLAR